MNQAALHTCTSPHCNTVSQMSVRTGLAARLALVLAWLKRAYLVHQQRRALDKLSDCQLADIGLERTAARHEAARAFWDFKF